MDDTRPPRRRTAALTATALGVALLLVSTACSGSGSSGSATTITLYNAQHEQTTNALISAFTAQTGIHVRVDSNTEDVLTAQIEQEGVRSPADVVYTENSNWLAQLDQKGLLASVDAATLANVPAIDSATDGDWVGVSARVSALVYNPNRVTASDLPTSVLGLADPKWKGKIEIAPSETDFWPIVSSVAKAHGDPAALNWLKGLKANAGSNANVPDDETLVSDVNDGITDMALVNYYYYYRLQAEVGPSKMEAKLAFFSPGDPGVVEDVSGAAVLKSSKHQAAAAQFLAFLTGQAGQTVLAKSDSFEYPLHAGVAANSVLMPLAQVQASTFSPADLGTGLDAKTLLQEAGLL